MVDKTIYSTPNDFNQFPFNDLKGGSPSLISNNNYFIDSI